MPYSGRNIWPKPKERTDASEQTRAWPPMADYRIWVLGSRRWDLGVGRGKVWVHCIAPSLSPCLCSAPRGCSQLETAAKFDIWRGMRSIAYDSEENTGGWCDFSLLSRRTSTIHSFCRLIIFPSEKLGTGVLAVYNFSTSRRTRRRSGTCIGR